MSFLEERIQTINKKNRKVLSIFLTAGYPSKKSFIDVAKAVIDNGADMLEVGVPFGDSLADGPVVQESFIEALKDDTTLKDCISFIEQIKSYSDVPLILMSSANPVSQYGIDQFTSDSKNAGVDGLIIPDIPLEEFEDFYDHRYNKLDKVILTTPTSSEERIKSIDEKSSGFVYCVSVVGTTGMRDTFNDDVLKNLERTYKTIKKNKMLIGFGIKSGTDIKRFAPYCDGVIVGSAVIKSLGNDSNSLNNTQKLIKESKFCLLKCYLCLDSRLFTISVNSIPCSASITNK
jgi:tryptophan synthase alpha chain